MLKLSFRDAMTMLNLKIFKGICVGVSFFASLSLAQSANAVIFNWQFTNEDGSFGISTDVVSGFVEFNDADVFPNATGVVATNLQISSVTGLPTGSDPFLGDGGMELNENLLLSGQLDVLIGNSVSFNASEEIISSNLDLRLLDDGGNRERLAVNLGANSFFNARTGPGSFPSYSDSDSDTLTFTQQSVPVPFEVNPTLGLLLVGGVSGTGYFKRKHSKSISKL